MSVQVQEPIADTPLSRSLSGGSLSYLPATRQEVLADGQAATKSMASSDNDNVQSGMQGTPNICHTSPELARALSHLHKQNGERFDEITQALEQDLRDNPKSSRPSMHKGENPHYSNHTHGSTAYSSNSSEKRLLQHASIVSMLWYRLTVL